MGLVQQQVTSVWFESAADPVINDEACAAYEDWPAERGTNHRVHPFVPHASCATIRHHVDPERGRSSDRSEYEPSALEGSRRWPLIRFPVQGTVLESDLPEEKRLPNIYAFDGLSMGRVILVPRHQHVANARIAEARWIASAPRRRCARESRAVSSNNEVDLDPLHEPVSKKALTFRSTALDLPRREPRHDRRPRRRAVCSLPLQSVCPGRPSGDPWLHRNARSPP